MHVSPSFLSPLLLAASLLALSAQEKKKWDPFFDYANVPPASEDMWAQIGQAPVQFEQALNAAREAEGEVRVMRAKQEATPRGNVWSFELFVGAATETPKRVNLEVSLEAPKVVHRLELLSLAPGEEDIWQVLKNVKSSPLDACATAQKRVAGDGTEPNVKVSQVRKVWFRPEATPPYWEIEVIGVDQQDHVQRWSVHVKSTGGAKARTLLDRFAGEPLRGAKPTELPNGLTIHDFEPGDGEAVTVDSKVMVNYRLFLLDGTVVHSTTEKKRPVTFVIADAPLVGMTEGMVGMRVGGRRKIVMPYSKGFGEQGNELAPPRATVVCDVSIEELVTQ